MVQNWPGLSLCYSFLGACEAVAQCFYLVLRYVLNQGRTLCVLDSGAGAPQRVELATGICTSQYRIKAKQTSSVVVSCQSLVLVLSSAAPRCDIPLWTRPVPFR